MTRIFPDPFRVDRKIPNGAQWRQGALAPCRPTPTCSPRAPCLRGPPPCEVKDHAEDAHLSLTPLLTRSSPKSGSIPSSRACRRRVGPPHTDRRAQGAPPRAPLHPHRRNRAGAAGNRRIRPRHLPHRSSSTGSISSPPAAPRLADHTGVLLVSMRIP